MLQTILSFFCSLFWFELLGGALEDFFSDIADVTDDQGAKDGDNSQNVESSPL